MTKTVGYKEKSQRAGAVRAGASKPQTKIPSKPQPEMQPQMWHSRACVRQEGSTVGADAFPALKGTGIQIFSG